MIAPCGIAPDGRPTIRLRLVQQGRLLWDDEVIVDTGFNASMIVPTTVSPGVPPDPPVGNVNCLPTPIMGDIEAKLGATS